MLNDFIQIVCDMLDIPMPQISFNIDTLPTQTTLALYVPEDNIIYLQNSDISPDLLFAVAHELRHKWQYITDKKFYLDGYKASSECISIEEYNLQIAEIDANAFASIVMVHFFHVKPQFKGLTEKVKSAISSRIDYILPTLQE